MLIDQHNNESLLIGILRDLVTVQGPWCLADWAIVEEALLCWPGSSEFDVTTLYAAVLMGIPKSLNDLGSARAVNESLAGLTSSLIDKAGLHWKAAARAVRVFACALGLMPDRGAEFSPDEPQGEASELRITQDWASRRLELYDRMERAIRHEISNALRSAADIRSDVEKDADAYIHYLQADRLRLTADIADLTRKRHELQEEFDRRQIDQEAELPVRLINGGGDVDEDVAAYNVMQADRARLHDEITALRLTRNELVEEFKSLRAEQEAELSKLLRILHDEMRRKSDVLDAEYTVRRQQMDKELANRRKIEIADIDKFRSEAADAVELMISRAQSRKKELDAEARTLEERVEHIHGMIDEFLHSQIQSLSQHADLREQLDEELADHRAIEIADINKARSEAANAVELMISRAQTRKNELEEEARALEERVGHIQGMIDDFLNSQIQSLSENLSGIPSPIQASLSTVSDVAAANHAVADARAMSKSAASDRAALGAEAKAERKASRHAAEEAAQAETQTVPEEAAEHTSPDGDLVDSAMKDIMDEGGPEVPEPDADQADDDHHVEVPEGSDPDAIVRTTVVIAGVPGFSRALALQRTVAQVDGVSEAKANGYQRGILTLEISHKVVVPLRGRLTKLDGVRLRFAEDINGTLHFTISNIIKS